MAWHASCISCCCVGSVWCNPRIPSPSQGRTRRRLRQVDAGCRSEKVEQPSPYSFQLTAPVAMAMGSCPSAAQLLAVS